MASVTSGCPRGHTKNCPIIIESSIVQYQPLLNVLKHSINCSRWKLIISKGKWEMGFPSVHFDQLVFTLCSVGVYCCWVLAWLSLSACEIELVVFKLISCLLTSTSQRKDSGCLYCERAVVDKQNYQEGWPSLVFTNVGACPMALLLRTGPAM